jgi:hypothetical protein
LGALCKVLKFLFRASKEDREWFLTERLDLIIIGLWALPGFVGHINVFVCKKGKYKQKLRFINQYTLDSINKYLSNQT